MTGLCVDTFSFLSDKFLVVGLLGLRVSHVRTYRKLIVSKVAEPFYIQTCNVWEFLWLHTLPARNEVTFLSFFFLKKIKHTQDSGNAVDSHDGLHSCFPNSDKCWASSVKCLQITYFVHILLGSVQSSFSYLFPSFLLFWNKSLLHILGTVSIEDMVFASLFLTLSFS